MWKKSWYSSWWDDDYSSPSSNKTTYSSWWSWWNSFNYWASYFSSFASWFADKEKIRKLKESISKKAIENFIPVNVNISGQTSSISKRFKFLIDIANSDVSKYTDDVVDKIPNAFNKTPYNASPVWNLILKNHLYNDAEIKKFTDDYPWFKKASDEYFAWVDGAWNMLSWVELQQKLEEAMGKLDQWKVRAYEKKETEQRKINEDGTMKSFSEIWDERKLQDKTLSNKFLALIKSKIHISDLTEKEESISKWKRINRNYVTGTSYKPLVNKQTHKKSKKKLFFIVDCSGSMWDVNSIRRSPSHMSVSFLDALNKSDIFEIPYIYFHSDTWFGNVAKKFAREPFGCEWWCEWFENIDINLNPAELSECDYVITLTDLDIWTSAQQWLYDFLKKSKKHLIISFNRSWDLNWMNVRTVKEPHQIVNSLLTILN